MVRSSDIRLDMSATPVYPDRCVRCGVERPGRSFTVVTNVVHLERPVPGYGERLTVEVPTCRECQRLMRLGRWFRGFVLLALVAILATVSIWMFGVDGRPSKVLLACIWSPLIAAYFVWIYLFAPTFNVSAADETITYEFKDAAYASDFARLNDVEYDEPSGDFNRRERDERFGDQFQ